MNFITHNSFLSNGIADRKLFWKDLIHKVRQVLHQLALEFIRAVRYGNSTQYLDFCL